jgi:hypothetical protein
MPVGWCRAISTTCLDDDVDALIWSGIDCDNVGRHTVFAFLSRPPGLELVSYDDVALSCARHDLGGFERDMENMLTVEFSTFVSDLESCWCFWEPIQVGL